MNVKSEFQECASFDDKVRSLLLSITGKRQFTALSDGGHTGLHDECLFANSDFIKGLASVGVKLFF